MALHSQLLQFLFSGLTSGSIIALVAVGFVTIFNVTGVLNFAQGEFAMVGAMLAVSLTRAGLPLPVAGLGAVLGTMAVGAVMERAAIHPARRHAPVTRIIITIGVAISVRGAALLIWGADPLALPPFSAGPPLFLLGASLVRQSLWVMGLALALMAFLYLFFARTMVGIALRACTINRLAARIMGIRPERMSLLTFALSAGLGAVAGVAITPITGAVYDMGLMLGLKAFVAAVLGGIHNVPAVIAGSLLVGVLEAMAAGLISSGYKDAITFLLLLVILVVRPSGLWGAVQGKRV